MGSKCRNKDQVGLRPGSHHEHCLMKISEVIDANMASTLIRSQGREQKCAFSSSLYRMTQMMSRLVIYLVRQHHDKDRRKRDF